MGDPNALYPRDWINFAIMVVTLLAIIFGPLWAVKFTRDGDERRERIARKFNIFRTLMQTRQISLHPDHVSSLNLVQIEFYDRERIIGAYKRYIEHLYKPLPELDAREHYFRERGDLFFEMLHEIGRDLGYSFDRRELEKFSYAPQGWGNDENQLRLFRQLIVEVLQGKRPLPVASFRLHELQHKFPPPPT